MGGSGGSGMGREGWVGEWYGEGRGGWVVWGREWASVVCFHLIQFLIHFSVSNQAFGIYPETELFAYFPYTG